MNRIIMSWVAAAALLIAVSATTGKTVEISAAASQAAARDDAAAALSERVLWSFGSGDDGQAPRANLIGDKWGNLYGTAQGGGANAITNAEVLGPNGGTVFELSPPAGQQTQWRERMLWSFGASGDGYYPWSGLVADKQGNLYGTTYCGGGTDSCFGSSDGTVFELSPPAGHQAQWRERVLWSFDASGDGSFPAAGLLADEWGNLFGTTYAGGANGSGTVFELSPPTGQQAQWRERVLWSFGASDDGAFPFAGLNADKRGNLYGTTAFGGANSCSGVIACGTVFELSPPAGQQPQWREHVLWSFGASGDGQLPYAGLHADELGNLYGTTIEGGANGSSAGTVFELSPLLGQQAQWSERVLWSFGASGDGNSPFAGLFADKRGNLYGTAEDGGAIGFGTVFELGLP